MTFDMNSCRGRNGRLSKLVLRLRITPHTDFLCTMTADKTLYA